MLHPAPTTQIDPTLARGTILEVNDSTESSPATVVMGFPNTSYKLTLIATDSVEVLRAQLGEIVLGRIFADAKRIDSPEAGGRRFDPCYGPPRRVMGTVVGTDPKANVLVMDAGVPILLKVTAPNQHASMLANAEFVACDVKPGARFSLQES